MNVIQCMIGGKTVTLESFKKSLWCVLYIRLENTWMHCILYITVVRATANNSSKTLGRLSS